MNEMVAFTTPASAPAWKRWLVFSPLARIVIYAACFFAVGYPLFHLATALHLGGKDASPLERNLVGLVLEFVSILLVYVVAVRLIERRRVSELALRQLPTYGIAGLIAGFLLLSTMTLLLWLMGSYHVLSVNADAVWLPSLLGMGIATGIAEETIFRGVLYRISEEGLGTWGALAISALFFGGAHLNNPNATLWSAVAIAIEAGILLALVYHLTRSLWMVIGLHAAWNFSEGTIYGFAVSGFNVKGIIVPSVTGSDWVTGGKFGVEGSVVAVAVSACISAVLLAIAIRRKTIVPPSWVRKRNALS
ncbi:type II CAAX endopeptidase family protein [Dyella sp.]|uniref:CPBP family intramembrane glutamic endopeptidase n=1 Tax=Dyella sp. TaxID=1869338 RepID=UPI002CB958CA|nr:type II CAAX endopeptidase family protein [Dyella sp.]HTC25446.1 type II CAAX endopeptidase family protein [Dyella sp.]